jgi:hypothetical protein
MPLNQNNEASNSNSPTLSIDFRSGSVVMRLGLDEWTGQLPMSSADCSQINTPGGMVELQKTVFA